MPGRLITTASADVPLKGLCVPARGGGQAAHRARRHAHGHRPARSRAGGPGGHRAPRPGRRHRRSCPGVTDERIVELYAEADAGRRALPLRGLLACPPSRRWPAAPAWSPPPAVRCPRSSGRTARRCCCCPAGDPDALADAIRRGPRRPRAARPHRRRRAPASGRALDLAALRPAHGRAVPRGPGHARRTGPSWRRDGPDPVPSADADRPLRPARAARGRPAARPRVRLRPPRLRGGRRGAPTSSPSTTPTQELKEVRHLRRHGRGRRDRARTRSPARSRATPPRCRSPTAPFDRVIASEVLEHIPDDARGASPSWPGCCGRAARWPSPCPPWLPETGQLGAVRRVPRPRRRRPRADLPRQPSCGDRLRAAGLRPRARHHAHALHSPYWWLRCAVGPTNDDHRAVARLPPAARVGHHRRPRGRPAGRARVLNPVLGKSLVVYARKPMPGVIRRVGRPRAWTASLCRRGTRQRDRSVDRRAPAARRDDPVVPGRPLRPVEPRRGGHGARPSAGRHDEAERAYRVAGRTTQRPDGGVVQLLPRPARRRGRASSTPTSAPTSPPASGTTGCVTERPGLPRATCGRWSSGRSTSCCACRPTTGRDRAGPVEVDGPAVGATRC